MAQTSSPLIFWTGTDPVSGNLADRFTSLNPDRCDLHVDLPQADAALQNSPDATLVLFYRNCETTLAQVLQDGADPARVLENWITEGQELLQVQRRNRRRCLVIEIDHFLRFASAGLTRLDLPSEAMNDLPDRTGPDPVALLIAQNLMGEYPAAMALAEELEASSTNLSNEDIPRIQLSADQIVKTHIQRHEHSKALAFTLNESQHHTLQAETAQQELSTQIADLKTQITQLSAQVDVDDTARSLMQNDMRQLETAYAQAEYQLDEARAEITQIQGVLAAKDTELHHKDEALDGQRGHIRDLETELDRVWQSASMRITSPLRRIMSILRPGRG